MVKVMVNERDNVYGHVEVKRGVNDDAEVDDGRASYCTRP
jgi:hypothetical protein